MTTERQLAKAHAEAIYGLRREVAFNLLQREIGSISVHEPTAEAGTMMPLTESIVSVINKKES